MINASVIDLSSINLSEELNQIRLKNINMKAKKEGLELVEAEKQYAKSMPLHEFQRVEHLLEMVSTIKDISSLLEIGPGRCSFAKCINSTRPEISLTLLDIVDLTKKRLPENIKLLNGSVTELPFKDNEIDLVVATEVLEHIEISDFFLGLNEIKRVAKQYIVSVPYLEREPIYKGHLQRFNEMSIKQWFPNEEKHILLKPQQGCPIIVMKSNKI